MFSSPIVDETPTVDNPPKPFGGARYTADHQHHDVNIMTCQRSTAAP
jgi:hypothetical protein